MSGREAYEKDCQRCPTYPDGQPRPGWVQLSEEARWSWNRNPTPRVYHANQQPAAKRALSIQEGE